MNPRFDRDSILSCPGDSKNRVHLCGAVAWEEKRIRGDEVVGRSISTMKRFRFDCTFCAEFCTICKGFCTICKRVCGHNNVSL